MKEFVLNYYFNFKCIAGECKHTCCAGWKTCIDAPTLNAYKNENSTFLETLKKGINFKNATFKQGKNRRCAFLNDNGLCEIIRNLGEEKLCQICRDHPRFKTSFTNITETGLGFCCEEATKIIYSFTDKISPVLISDDFNNEEVTFLEKAVLDFKKQALGVLQDRNVSINDRVNNLLNLCNANFIKNYGKKIIKKFCLLEKLSKSWGARLKAVKNANFNLTVDENLSLYCEQFLVNSLYRHLSTAEDITNAYAITVACVISWALIQLIYNAEVCSGSEFLTLIDITRDFSANVEYSPNNVNKLFNFAYQFVY